jgi:pimeloyl-ACP methyl ester carboxylesterase
MGSLCIAASTAACCIALLHVLLQVVASLLDQLQAPAKVVVVGHDWGAAVAWAFAFTHPDRVAKLAVLSVGFPGELAQTEPQAGCCQQRADRVDNGVACGW